MPRRPSTSGRARGLLGLTLALGGAVLLSGAAWSGGIASSAARTGAGDHHGGHVHARSRKHHGPKLPSIGNATDLGREPVVHRSRAKPPRKLEVKDLVVGTGAPVTMASTVSVVYVGANYKTGKDFTQVTWTTGHPTTFPLTGVVRGFAEGLVGMKVGGRREIVIPPKLGYGSHNYGPIKANETLVFVVDLKAVR